MSNEKINNHNNKEDKYTNIEFILPKNIRINNIYENHKLFNSEKSSEQKLIPKIKLNYPKKDLKLNYFNKNNKRKINNIINTPSKYPKYFIGNYKNMITSPLSPQNNNSVNFSNKLINNIYNLNNLLNNKSKIILPKIYIKNKKGILNTKKEKIRSIRKKISLVDLLKDKYKDVNFTEKNQNLFNSSSHSKSDWHLITEAKKDNNNDELNLEDLFNKKYGKYADILNEINNKNIKMEKKVKNGAERLKEFHRQKLINCRLKIKNMAKETEHKKDFLNKYILLMRQNFENSAEFNIDFI